ncbi:Gfo/Idh/MocA family protein [Phreatobacter stygius]|uniref:Gfo/Idh/MocA family oxidoreductase n=1 Tax=Phreatobacter stygius TaxID=1940610 RepID=A0A4D7B4K8_9HYPH|nr:Gfo/Idh/MocA family oxidoreductase [Phreatobacter stygius]QCI65953.1 Gfo/Idh/MocA family oxidoreductase [Phreatobacter stygius]
MAKLRMAVVGAGAIGRAHAEVIAAGNVAELAAIVDPTDAGRAVAVHFGVPWFVDQDALLAAGTVDAAIVATPNQTHLPVSLAFIERGIPVLVEKPIASTLAEARALTAAAEKAGVAVLVGHHRRHNPIARRARDLVRSGTLGRLTSVSVLYTFLKPDSYFELDWRRRAGGGPVLINLIHEIDLIRFICGEIESVQAVTSNAVRGFEVEDSAAVILRLAGGALVTVNVSDTAVAPWSWDMATRESQHYPQLPVPVNSHYLSGTAASLTLPQLDLWRYPGKAGWHEPIARETVPVERADPYAEQIRHLCAVARGEEQPVISAADGTRTLEATLAVHEAARIGAPVALSYGQ